MTVDLWLRMVSNSTLFWQKRGHGYHRYYHKKKGKHLGPEMTFDQGYQMPNGFADHKRESENNKLVSKSLLCKP
jgi:hypothetical protein